MYGLYLSRKELQKTFNLEDSAGQLKYSEFFYTLSSSYYGIDDIFLKNQIQNPFPNHAVEGSIHESFMTFRKRMFAKFLIEPAYSLYLKNPKIITTILGNLPTTVIARLKKDCFSALHKYRTYRYQKDLAIKKNKILIDNLFDDKRANQIALQYEEKRLCLIGYVSGDFGVAENLRAAAGSLLAVQYPVDIYEIKTHGVHQEGNGKYRHLITQAIGDAIELICVNADQVPLVVPKISRNLTHINYRIGIWFWELEKFPDDWSASFDYVDEIWAPSKFIAENLAKASSKPVLYMPVAVEFNLESPPLSREYFGLSNEKFTFLFSYDFQSFSSRKNPEAVIRAFNEAFPSEQMGVELVIKLSNANKDTEMYDKLLMLAKLDSRVKLIDQLLTRDEMYGLINCVDCYVSLHRSEGFGLGLAEAMYLGKPVIATGYSGNMTFMTNENSCVVDYESVQLAPHDYPYWEDQVWASPNVSHAAYYMKRLYEDEEYRNNIATKGRKYIKSEHSFAKVGELMRVRLQQLNLSLSAGAKL
jgi:glycosyltransferase involved in cell wall biosynthesis